MLVGRSMDLLQGNEQEKKRLKSIKDKWDRVKNTLEIESQWINSQRKDFLSSLSELNVNERLEELQVFFES